MYKIRNCKQFSCFMRLLIHVLAFVERTDPRATTYTSSTSNSSIIYIGTGVNHPWKGGGEGYSFHAWP